MPQLQERLPIGFRNLLGPLYTRYVARHSRQVAGDYRARLRDALGRISSEARECIASPVFVLSAGWRSGSTLLQRMIMEGNDNIMIWGEPYDRSNIFDCMASQFRSFTDYWPKDHFFISGRGKKLSDEWVANLYPDVDYLLNAHRKFFDALFGEQARTVNKSQWGVKEVRLTVDHANYLRILFPRCKLLFLCRNPRDAYLSYRKWGSSWYKHWPEQPVATAYSFGRNWAELALGFIDRHAEVDGLLVRYEDLDEPKVVGRIESYLGWPVPRASKMRRIGKQGDGAPGEKLSLIERQLLDFGAARAYRKAGY